MIETSIYIDGLGYRNVFSELDQIIWFFEQTVKNKSKSLATRFWLDIRETYSKRLLKLEAFELLNFIQSKATTAQEIRRAIGRIKRKEQSDAEYENFMGSYKEKKAVRELIKQIGLN